MMPKEKRIRKTEAPHNPRKFVSGARENHHRSKERNFISSSFQTTPLCLSSFPSSPVSCHFQHLSQQHQPPWSRLLTRCGRMYPFASQCSLHSQYSSTHSCSGSENGHVLGERQTSSHPPHYYLRSRAVSFLHQKTCQWWGSSYHSLPSSHCERSHTLTAKRAPHKRDCARFTRPECW